MPDTTSILADYVDVASGIRETLLAHGMICTDADDCLAYTEPDEWSRDPEISRGLHNLFVALHFVLTGRENWGTHQLIAYATELLVACGLPEECLTGPIPWVGSPEQIEALARLHRAICEMLPPLPSQEGQSHAS